MASPDASAAPASAAPLLRTALYRVQASAGARMVGFGGWEMPVQFSGIAAEHRAVRSAVGVFDLGHMGRLRLDGSGAAGFLAQQVCRRTRDLSVGRVRYGLILAADGTVEDDVLVSREAETAFHIVVNAGNRAKVLGLWRAALPRDARLTDLTDSQAMIAVQGPRALDLLTGLGLNGTFLKNYAFADLTWQGVPVRLSRTGYTGEDGAECFLPSSHAEAFWQAVVAAGALPCGLGARDILRLEAAMPLYGHELDRSITPVEAGLAFAIDREAHFIGAPTVLAQLNAGAPRTLVGLRVQNRRVPRQGNPVLNAAGTAIGAITSGTLSPSIDQAIGLALIRTSEAITGTTLTIDIRGSLCPAEVVSLPFYTRKR